MNVLASVLLVTGICLILRSLLDIVPKWKQRREEKRKE